VRTSQNSVRTKFVAAPWTTFTVEAGEPVLGGRTINDEDGNRRSWVRIVKLPAALWSSLPCRADGLYTAPSVVYSKGEPFSFHGHALQAAFLARSSASSERSPSELMPTFLFDPWSVDRAVHQLKRIGAGILAITQSDRSC